MRMIKKIAGLGAALMGGLLAAPAIAQTGTYQNTTPGVIDGTTTCAAPITRTISVADSFTIADVNLGFLAIHTWRTDIQLDLRSPAGTSV